MISRTADHSHKWMLCFGCPPGNYHAISWALKKKIYKSRYSGITRFPSNGKQTAHNGSMCPLYCTTHKHLLDVGGRGPGLQRQEAQKRTAWTWPQYIPESEPALKTPSWQQYSSRSYHEEAGETELQHNGGVQVRKNIWQWHHFYPSIISDYNYYSLSFYIIKIYFDHS